MEVVGKSGYLGSLTKEEQQVLTVFKALLQKFAAERWKYDLSQFDEYDYLRFLRARKFEIKASVQMFDAYINWRKTEGLDQIYVFQH